MKIDIKDGIVTVIREPKDKKVYKEAYLLRLISRELNTKHKMDTIVKRMHKDGHMVSDEQLYIRDRKWQFAIWDAFGWAIRFTYTPFNQDGKLVLKYEDWHDAPKGKPKASQLEKFTGMISHERSKAA